MTVALIPSPASPLPQLGPPPITPRVKLHQPNTPQLRNRLASLADGYWMDELAPQARVSLTCLAAHWICNQWAPA